MLRPGIEPVISFTGVRDYARSAVASWTRLTIYNRRNDWLLCFVFACFLGIRSIYNLMNLNCNMGRGNIFLLSHQFALTLTFFFFSVFWVCISQRKVCAWFCMLPCGRHKTIVHCSLFYMATARQISPYLRQPNQNLIIIRMMLPKMDYKVYLCTVINSFNKISYIYPYLCSS